MSCKMIYVALSIASRKQQNTSCIEIYRHEIERYASLSDRTVRRYLPELEKIGLIKVEPQDRMADGKYKKCKIWLYDCIDTGGHLVDRSWTDRGQIVDTESDIYKKTNKQINKKTNTVSLKEKNFNLFWEKYPKKVGKAAAAKSWAKISKPKQTLRSILAALDWQIKSEQWTRESGRYIPNPSTYLNQSRWLDEPIGEINNPMIGGVIPSYRVS